MANTSTIDGSKLAYAVSLRNSGAITQQGATLPSVPPAGALPIVATALARVPDGGINFEPVQTSLLSDFQDIMGDSGADTDGFDLILSDALLDIDSDSAGFAALGDTLAIADFNAGDLDSALFNPVAQDLSGFTKAGQSLFDTMAGAVAVPGAAAGEPGGPAPTPPPPGSGGGEPTPEPVLPIAPGGAGGGDPGIHKNPIAPIGEPGTGA